MTDVDARSDPWPDWKLCQIGQIRLGQIGQLCGQSGAARLEYPIERNRAIEPIGQIDCRAASIYLEMLNPEP